MGPSSPQTRPTRSFLIVDDDAVSVMAVKRALKALDVPDPVAVAGDGREALDLLETMSLRDKGNDLPVIVILDVNMPRMNGREFLAELAARSDLAGVCVYVQTSTGFGPCADIERSPHVAGYICKENTRTSLHDALQGLELTRPGLH